MSANVCAHGIAAVGIASLKYRRACAMQPTSIITGDCGRVEMWRGGVGAAYLLPALSSLQLCEAVNSEFRIRPARISFPVAPLSEVSRRGCDHRRRRLYLRK